MKIYESRPAEGGWLTYGIPSFKLPNEVVFNRTADLKRAGVEFVYNTYIGEKITIDDLIAEGADAVFVGVGAEVDAPLDVPGEDLPGVYKAGEFLARSNADGDHLPQ